MNKKTAQRGKFSIVILFVVFLLIAGAAGYFVYEKVLMTPAKILALSTEKMNQFDTVHMDMELDSTMRSKGVNTISQTDNTKMTGFMDYNDVNKDIKGHFVVSANNDSIEMDMIIIGEKTIYMKMPLLFNSWIQIDADEMDENPFGDIDSNDFLSEAMGALDAVDEDKIIKLEDEVIDGIKTYHFRYDIGTDKYIEALKSAGVEDEGINVLRNANIKSDVWIDKKTKMVVKMMIDTKNGQVFDRNNQLIANSDSVMTITFSKYGEPVTISKPTENVMTMEEFAAQFANVQGVKSFNPLQLR